MLGFKRFNLGSMYSESPTPFSLVKVHSFFFSQPSSKISFPPFFYGKKGEIPLHPFLLSDKRSPPTHWFKDRRNHPPNNCPDNLQGPFFGFLSKCDSDVLSPLPLKALTVGRHFFFLQYFLSNFSWSTVPS